MGKNRALMTRWRNYKLKQRKTSYFARGLQKKLTGFDWFELRERDVYHYGDRARNGAGLSTEQLDNHNTAICKLLGFEVGDFKQASDPYLDKEGLLTKMKFDPQFHLNKFNHYSLEETSIGFTWVFFSGQEYFIIEKRDTMLRRSNVYSSRENLIQRWKCNALTWVKKEFITSS